MDGTSRERPGPSNHLQQPDELLQKARAVESRSILPEYEVGWAQGTATVVTNTGDSENKKLTLKMSPSWSPSCQRCHQVGSNITKLANLSKPIVFSSSSGFRIAGSQSGSTLVFESHNKYVF